MVCRSPAQRFTLSLICVNFQQQHHQLKNHEKSSHPSSIIEKTAPRRHASKASQEEGSFVGCQAQWLVESSVAMEHHLEIAPGSVGCFWGKKNVFFFTMGEKTCLKKKLKTEVFRLKTLKTCKNHSFWRLV